MRIYLSFLVCLLTLGMASAHAMRCGDRLVSEGDSRGRVAALCGEPADIQRTVAFEIIRVRHHHHGHPGHPAVEIVGAEKEVQIPVLMEEWLYNFGPNRFMQRLYFRNGELVEIDSQRYGY